MECDVMGEMRERIRDAIRENTVMIDEAAK